MKKILSIIIFLQFIQLPSQVKRMDLHSNWKFTESQKSDWKSATVPGNIHTDLFNNQIIPHPFVGENEKDLQWISENNWTYQTEFELTKEQLNYENIDLVFEGLDTYAKVYLNDKLILDVENAFRIYKADVKKRLKKKNTLRIEFTNPNSIEENKAQKNPYKLPEGNRIFTRKAQFQYGWDWGPKYNTMGIWRPVYLEFWNDVKIEDVYIKQNHLSESQVDLTLELTILDRMAGIRRFDVLLTLKMIKSFILSDLRRKYLKTHSKFQLKLIILSSGGHTIWANPFCMNLKFKSRIEVVNYWKKK